LELDGCVTQGDTKAELDYNMREALNLHLSEPDDSDVIFPFPKKTVRGRGIVQVEVEPGVAFALILRTMRLKHGMTQKEAAKLLGFKSLFSYQRLDNPENANPELATLVKVKRAFPEFSVDEILAA
jgi:antitoxin HicB